MSLRDEIKDAVQYWWILLIMGIALIVSSFYIYAIPVASYLTLSMLFAVMILIDGISSLAFAIANRKSISHSGWRMISGIFSIVLGGALFIHPALSMSILPVFIGFWVMMKGSLTIGIGLDMGDTGMTGSGWTIFFGVINLLIGVSMIVNPIFGASLIVMMTALSFLMVGVSMTVMAFRLRRVKQVTE